MSNTPAATRCHRPWKARLQRFGSAAAVVAASVGVVGVSGDLAAAAHPTPCTQYYYPTQARVNVRRGPGTSYTILGQTHMANEILCGPGIEYRTNDGSRGCSTGWWAKIRWYQATGYICTTYVWWN